MRHCGSAYGYAIESPQPIPFLRQGPGVPLIVREQPAQGDTLHDAGELLVEWRRRPEAPFWGRVRRDRQGHLHVWTSDGGWFVIDAGAPSVTIEPHEDRLAQQVRLLTTPMLLLMLRRGDHPLHASAVAVGNGAVVMVAPGRRGKTTLAAAMAGRGHPLLAEDVVCLEWGEVPTIVPGPGLLRLRPDVVDEIDLGRGRIEARRADRVFVAFDGDQPRRLPITAVVLLRAGSGEPRLERVGGPEVMRDLWAVSFGLPTDEDRRRCLTGVTEIADRLPVFDLHRPLEWFALQRTMDLLEGEFTT